MSSTSIDATWPARARRITIDRERLKESAPLAVLLGLTAGLYLWGLSRNGWANEYYAAAVQAGTHSWKAFLFGSLDAANYITVDKPPASLWLMELSSRIFGFSSFSMLLPQALEGVAAVALLYATVRRWFGRSAALLSGVILAITPVAALMFRFNNPDALLVLLLVAAAYALTRSLERGSTRWLVLCAGALGFGFLTKELQALLVLPAFALAYLVAAPVPLARRIWQLALAGVALVLSAGWWVALVELWPVGSRPYIGDSTHNSILQVIFGSNGLDRISSGGTGPGGAGAFSGSAGVTRLFNIQMGGQISWLLPAAVIASVAGVIWTIRRPRTDRTRAALILWGGWLIVSAAIYSLMTGIIHPYYTDTLAPAIAALVGIGTVLTWRRRDRLRARLLLAGTLAVTGIWAYVLLDRAAGWNPWLRFAILLSSLAAALVIVVGRRVADSTRTAAATVGLLAVVAGPAAYALSAVGTDESGANPLAGPAVAQAAGFGRRALPGGGRSFAGAGAGQGATVDRALSSLLKRNPSRYTWVAATSSAQTGASLELAAGKPVMAIGGFGGSDAAITLKRFEQLVAEHKIHYYVSGGGPGGVGGPTRGPASPGGAFGAAPPAGIGGLPGAPPAGFGPRAFGFGGPTAGPGGFGARGQTVASQIQSWVQSHFTSATVGGATVYNLTVRARDARS